MDAYDSLCAVSQNPVCECLSMNLPLIKCFKSTLYFTYINQRLTKAKFWCSKVQELDYIYDFFYMLGSQLDHLIRLIKKHANEKKLIDEHLLQYPIMPKFWNLLKNDGISQIIEPFNSFILEEKERVQKQKNLGNNTGEGSKPVKLLNQTIQGIKPESQNKMKNKSDLGEREKSLNQNVISKYLDKVTMRWKKKEIKKKPKTEIKASKDFILRVQSLKWRLKRSLLYELSKSKIVKKIFYYNNLLINYSMTSPKIINKLNINMTSQLNNYYVNMTSIGQSWSVGKSYAELLSKLKDTDELQTQCNTLNIEVQAWLDNWNIDELLKWLKKAKKNEYKKITWNNKKRIYEILREKEKLKEFEKWCKWYAEEEKEIMEVEK